MPITSMEQLDLTHKTVIIREDLNVPINNGKITNDSRIKAAIPTIQAAIKQQAKVILLSHLGRPEPGKFEEKYSLAPVAKHLGEILQQPIKLITNWLDESFIINPGEVILAENVRFLPGETTNDEALAKKMASLCDIFVLDAFGAAHRAHASTAGIASFAAISCAGPLLEKEINALSQALKDPAKPVTAIVGGAKVSTKLTLLKNLINKVDNLILGGGILNTFIAAKGLPVGKSLYEPDLVTNATELLTLAAKTNKSIPMPIDVIVATEFSATANAVTKNVAEIAEQDMILDLGPQTMEKLGIYIEQSNTIVWNGPVGVFEFPAFSKGTQTLANKVAASNAFSIAGGGDTIAAIDQFNIADKVSYISTGGGAFLELLEGKTLPAIKALEQ